MKIRPRVIPSLLIDNGKLVKTTKFNKAKYIGDPINAVKIYNEKEVDELCILDITASLKGKGPNFELLEEIASEAFMPLSYGGGITQVEEARKIFKVGYEKIILNNSLYTNEKLIKDLVDTFGSQSIIASIDYKEGLFGKMNCFRMSSRYNCKISPVDMAQKVNNLGVGEIILYSIDRDGQMTGYDINTIKSVSEKVDIPVVALGGAGKIEDLYAALNIGKANAVAAGSLFVYWGKQKAVLINYPTDKEFERVGIYYEE